MKKIKANTDASEFKIIADKKGVPCITYYDLDNQGYRTATTSWRIR